MPHLPQNESNYTARIKLADLQPTLKLNVKPMLALAHPPLNPVINPLRRIPHPIHHKPQRKTKKTIKTTKKIGINNHLALKTAKLEEMSHVITDDIRKSSQASSHVTLLNEKFYGGGVGVEGTRKEI